LLKAAEAAFDKVSAVNTAIKNPTEYHIKAEIL